MGLASLLPEGQTLTLRIVPVIFTPPGLGSMDSW